MGFVVAQIVVSVFLIGVILLQMQGSGVSNVFGGGGEFYRSRRSVEKFLVWITLFLTTLFAFLSVILLIPR